MQARRGGLFFAILLFTILLLGGCDDYRRVRPLLDQQRATPGGYLELKSFENLEAGASFPSEKAAHRARLQRNAEGLRRQAAEIKRDQGAE